MKHQKLLKFTIIINNFLTQIFILILRNSNNYLGYFQIYNWDLLCFNFIQKECFKIRWLLYIFNLVFEIFILALVFFYLFWTPQIFHGPTNCTFWWISYHSTNNYTFLFVDEFVRYVCYSCQFKWILFHNCKDTWTASLYYVNEYDHIFY